MSLRLAVFDCDGTLIDSQANILRAVALTFTDHGLPVPDNHAIRRIVGLSLYEAMAALIPDADPDLHQSLASDYKTAFQRLRADRALDPEPLFPGVAEGLAALAGAGWLLGVATGKSDRGLRLALEHHGLFECFVTLQTADRHPSKPHPAMLHAALADAGAEPHQAVIIGDTGFDMAMGIAAGVRPIGVTWGYHETDDLLAAGASTIVDDMPALLEAVR